MIMRDGVWILIFRSALERMQNDGYDTHHSNELEDEYNTDNAGSERKSPPESDFLIKIDNDPHHPW